jgi:hypothetical protein
VHVFAGVAVSDFDVAAEWYVRLFGGPPTMIPTHGEAVWRLTDTASVYIVADDARAGSALVTIAVRDLDELGLEPDRMVDEPGAPLRAVFADPDGNTLSFFAES